MGRRCDERGIWLRVLEQCCSHCYLWKHLFCCTTCIFKWQRISGLWRRWLSSLVCQFWVNFRNTPYFFLSFSAICIQKNRDVIHFSYIWIKKNKAIICLCKKHSLVPSFPGEIERETHLLGVFKVSVYDVSAVVVFPDNKNWITVLYCLPNST